MSHLVPGDEDLHYCDNSHRFVRPGEPNERADAFHAGRIRAHMQAHRDNPNQGEDIFRRNEVFYVDHDRIYEVNRSYVIEAG